MEKQFNPSEIFMLRCLQIAQLGRYSVAPNPMVGAVLVDSATNHIIAEGWHQHHGGPHAEVQCIRNAEQKGVTDFSSLTLYVSLEPCSHFGKTPPCADLIVRKGIKQVVIGTTDPNPQVSGEGIKRLQNNGITVKVGVLETMCRQINKRFFCQHQKKRPFIILKWAQSADGFIDIVRQPFTEDNNSMPIRISTDVTKRIVHQMRAENMAILIGSNTALLDNPHLLNRKWIGKHPIRILLDKRHRVPKHFNLFSQDAETIVYNENTDWPFVVSDLYNRGIQSVLVEGGATILNSIFDSQIWDETHIEINTNLVLHKGIKAPQVPYQPFTIKTTDGNLLYTYYSNQF